MDIFYLFLVINFAVYFFEQYLFWRQYRTHVENKVRPEILSSLITKEKYAKAWRYQIDKDKLNFVNDFFKQLQNTIFIFGGGMHWLWSYCRLLTANEILYSSIFFATFLILQGLINLPLKYLETFGVEQKHNFNQQTLKMFLKDNLIKSSFEVVTAIPTLIGILMLFQYTGDNFFLYSWLFVSGIVFFTIEIYSNFVAPMLDEYSQLSDGNLKSKIDALSKKVNFPLKQLFVVEGSKRSSHSNAYIYGFGSNQKVVLFDTLLPSKTQIMNYSNLKVNTSENLTFKNKDSSKADMIDDEVVAILCHEFGHWKMNHNLIHLIIAEINLFLTFYIFQALHLSPSFLPDFGFNGSNSIIIEFMLISHLGIYSKLSTILQTILNRKMEFSADLFAAKMGFAEALSSGLLKLGLDNLEFPINDSWHSMLYRSHPSILDRIEALKKFK